MNISKYSPLLGSSYIELPDELNYPKKSFINIRNKDNKYFLWYHVAHLNLVDNHSTRVNREDRRIAGIDFPVSEKNYCKIEDKSGININVFSYDDSTIYPIYISNKNFNNNMDLLLIFSGDISHYVFIKDFNRLMFSRTKNKNKKYFCRRSLQCFSSENISINHKENCLVINGKQSVKLNGGSICFKNYSRQIPAPFKTYVDFECILKESKALECDSTDEDSSYTKKYQSHIPCGFAYKVVCIDDRFMKDIVIYRGKDCINRLITMILTEYEYCKNIMKENFNKNLIMSVKEEVIFQSSNKCWIFNKLFDFVDGKVREHCHIYGKYRGTAHFSCNANLKITKKIPAIFNNLKGYDSHLIIKEISNFDVNIDVIPNGLEKHMASVVNRNLVFIDSMQFMNASLDSLVKNLVDFKYLPGEFEGEYIKVVKEKGVHPYEYMNSF